MSAGLVTQDQRFSAALMSPVTDWENEHFTSSIPFLEPLFRDGNREVLGHRFHNRCLVAHVSKTGPPCLNIAVSFDRCTPAGQADEFHRGPARAGGRIDARRLPAEGARRPRLRRPARPLRRISDSYGEHL